METTKFITKDSGKRVDYKSGMRRDTDDGKPRYDLIIPLGNKNSMLKRWAELMQRGMSKYGYRNWEKANSEEELIRFKASAFRHFIQWFTEEQDEDHAAACFFNINAVEWLKEKLIQLSHSKRKLGKPHPVTSARETMESVRLARKKLTGKNKTVDTIKRTRKGISH